MGAYHIGEQDRILSDMMAPRGLPTRLLLFAGNAKLVAAYEADFTTGGRPLWCEGSRIYLAGFCAWHFADADSENRRIPPDPGLARLFSGTDPTTAGNLIDFSNGPLNPFLIREKCHGSSGGIEDNPWNKP